MKLAALKNAEGEQKSEADKEKGFNPEDTQSIMLPK